MRKCFILFALVVGFVMTDVSESNAFRPFFGRRPLVVNNFNRNFAVGAFRPGFVPNRINANFFGAGVPVSGIGTAGGTVIQQQSFFSNEIVPQPVPVFDQFGRFLGFQ